MAPKGPPTFPFSKTLYTTAMQYIPIKTRILQPPQDDLFALLDDTEMNISDGDVLLITSKIVSIHQGRCVPVGKIDKKSLVEQEAEYLLTGYEKYAQSPLAIAHHALFYNAGIDESNAADHYVLLPTKPFDIAEQIWQHLCRQRNLKKLAVIITDSHSTPMRSGAVGVALAWWGFYPVESHKGKKDLFGRPLSFSVTNIVDCLAAGGGAVCGETNESTPLVLIKNVPNLVFTKNDTRHELFRPYQEDIYYPILKSFYDKSN